MTWDGGGPSSSRGVLPPFYAHELCMLCSMSCFICASLANTYQMSTIYVSDVMALLALMLYLSRPLLHRFIFHQTSSSSPMVASICRGLLGAGGGLVSKRVGLREGVWLIKGKKKEGKGKKKKKGDRDSYEEVGYSIMGYVMTPVVVAISVTSIVRPGAALGGFFGLFTLAWLSISPYPYPGSTDLIRWGEVTAPNSGNLSGLGFQVAGEKEEPLLKTIAVNTLVRVLENLFVAVIVPHGRALCDAFGRCEVGQEWGHTGGNLWMRWGLCVSASIVTASVLLCQAISLNRSHLNAVAIMSGEWRVVDDEFEGKKPNPMPPVWDEAKKYKAGDLVTVHFPKDNLYRCYSTNPKSSPTDVFLRASHDLFTNEISQTSSSYGISTVCKLHLVHSFAVYGASAYIFLYHPHLSVVTLFTTAANLIAGYTMSNANVFDYRTKNKISASRILGVEEE
ncbi:hypothetical protein TrVE_jg11648 [Triparma verrucosa]|uniref:Uncharacterized protein n=2 Tax=Triparma TaxID=722752 RepID=A0A9W7C0K0_9STRA|nr:hypothetical protein TrVE_jg11648 [Triparma verrucosa]GMI00003.1 hypothetical protein TrST_g6184 [Triparma strigata]